MPLPPPAILPWRDRADVVNRLLAERFETLLPGLMRECGLDMWVVINREYAEDPVYLTLVPEPVFSARRTTMLVFFDRGEGTGIERLTVSRYGLGEFFSSAWPEGGSCEAQWQRLAEVIAERDPSRIGVNVSRDWAFGDGLSQSAHEQLIAALGPELSQRVTSAEDLCIRWLETRSRAELELYPHPVQIARGALAEAFSNRVITPGVTTTDDVAWWLRQRFSDLGLPAWFQPYCNVQRAGHPPADDAVIIGIDPAVIQRGDLLHTDVGLTYCRLHTDNQEMGYVCHADEDAPPAGLVEAMRTGNRWQDILCSNFVTGRTGNEILAATRAAAAAAGIDAQLYSHPLGAHGHAAGPTIGMWDNQGPTPVQGDWVLHRDTCYAIEGSVTVPVPEWDNQRVQIKLEQDGWFDGKRVVFIGGRQTQLHIVR